MNKTHFSANGEWCHGLNQRKFTREFKEAAVRRLELGALMAEVARAREVSHNVLHRWRRELREFGAKAFTGPGRSRADEDRIAALERKWAGKR
jgi:transposase-like protein